jgi:hypothetical protein
MQKQYKIWGSIIVVFYVVCFGFLRIHDFQVWTLAPFIESLIGVFMGAGAIAVITGIILIFQSSIQAEQEKKQKVFDKKMNLYQSIITEMNEKFKVREGEENSMITPEERLELFFTQLNIALLSKPKTFRLFSEMLNDISDEEGKITDDAPKKLLRFIQEAREDLDVQEPMTAEDIADFSAAVKIAEKEAESLSKPYQRAIYENAEKGFEEYFTYNRLGNDKYSEIRGLLMYINSDISKKFKDKYWFQYSRSMGSTFYCVQNNKQSKIGSIEIWTGRKQIGLGLYRDPENDFRKPIMGEIKGKNRQKETNYSDVDRYVLLIPSKEEYDKQSSSIYKLIEISEKVYHLRKESEEYRLDFKKGDAYDKNNDYWPNESFKKYVSEDHTYVVGS